MITSVKIKVLIKFGTSGMLCVELREENCTDHRDCVSVQYRKILSICTHTEVTNAMPTVYTTLDDGYRHKNKGTDQIWYSRNVACRTES